MSDTEAVRGSFFISRPGIDVRCSLDGNEIGKKKQEEGIDPALV